jgi:hypothetical protein
MTPCSWLSVRPSIRKGAIAAWAFAWLLGSLGDTASAQQTRARGKSEQARVITRNEIPLGDMTTGRLESLFRVLRSDAPEWDNAQVFSVRFSDPSMRQNQTMRGHMIVIHPGGERTFLEYEFKWKLGGSQRNLNWSVVSSKEREVRGHHGALDGARRLDHDGGHERVGGRVLGPRTLEDAPHLARRRRPPAPDPGRLDM